MTIFISLDETLVGRINSVVEKYNRLLLPLEIVLGKFKGIFVKDIGQESYSTLYNFLKGGGEGIPPRYSYFCSQQISISNASENFDIDLTQYNIRIQPVKSQYYVEGITHEFKSELGGRHTIRMFNHPDGSWQTSIFFRGGHHTITQLFQPLKVIFKPITKTNYLISYTERRQVTESYNILVKKKGKTPNIVFNKPYNLTRENLSEILNPSNEYLIFPKLDGVRYFLYFIDGSCYLLNYTDFLKLSDGEDAATDDTLLDGEFIDGIYYPFDVLWWRGGDLRRLSRLDRLNHLKNLNSTFKMIVIPPLKDIKTGLEKYKKGVEGAPPLDGVIITGNSSPYLNNRTFKYKPREEQLIDFSIGWYDTNKIELYVKDYNNSSTLFRGSEKNPYRAGGGGYINIDKCCASQIDILKKGGVIECRWDDGGQSFFPVRNRTDKISPNFVEVAKSIWDEIKDPVEIVFNSPSGVVLRSPISSNLILVEKTGQDIFDSILHSGAEKYRNMEVPNKKSFIKTLRQNFINTPTIEEWLKLDGGVLAFNCYKKEFIENFIQIYNTTTVESPRLKNNIYYDIFHSRPVNFFTDTVIPEMAENYQNSTNREGTLIPTFFKSRHFKDGEKKYEKYETAIDLLFSEISNFSIRGAYKKFIGKICLSQQLEQEIVDYMSLIFKKDIYVIDISTGLPISRTCNIKHVKSIVVAHSAEENKFWSVGRGLDNRIETVFLPDDELIRKIAEY